MTELPNRKQFDGMSSRLDTMHGQTVCVVMTTIVTDFVTDNVGH